MDFLIHSCHNSRQSPSQKTWSHSQTDLGLPPPRGKIVFTKNNKIFRDSCTNDLKPIWKPKLRILLEEHEDIITFLMGQTNGRSKKIVKSVWWLRMTLSSCPKDENLRYIYMKCYLKSKGWKHIRKIWISWIDPKPR